MRLKIGSSYIENFNEVSVTLQYDSVASTFGFSLYFDPERADHRQLFQPCRYAPVVVEHEGETLITGTLLSHSFTAAAEASLMQLGGYSKTGVLEDCQIPLDEYPLQSNNLSLERICRKLIKPFGLDLVVDPIVQKRVSEAYRTVKADDSQTIKSYLSELAGQEHIMLTHNAAGDLVLTEARADDAPVWHFEKGQPGVKFSLGIDGQKMHSDVAIIKQATKGRKDGTHKKGNAGQSELFNPYVANSFRPRVTRQTSGEFVDTKLAARNMLSEELKAIPLTIEIEGWTLGGKIIRPNTCVTIQHPDLFLYARARFFIAQVEYTGNESAQTATLTCYLPEVYNATQPKNIFA